MRLSPFVIACIVIAPVATAHAQDASPHDTAASQVETETVRIPGTTVTFELAPVTTPDGGPIHVLTTEVTWDLYDVFVYQLDTPEEDASSVDAVSRPSKPYVPPDRGMGHDGYPAMGMTIHAARAFCDWLSMKTGDTYRLPTLEEWRHFALAGSEPPYHFDESEHDLEQFAWTKENAEFTSHPVGGKTPNTLGLHDIHGNVAEWVETGEDENARPRPKPAAAGGSWRQPAEEATSGSLERQASHWNASDPQIPKSVWWLADCSWVGFRFVREPGPAAQDSADPTNPDAPSDP
ncbi:MAG: formylglycine-generating enzyme family protein [Phycisphaerales bacterium JB040]